MIISDKTKQTLKKILHLLKPYTKKIILIILCTLSITLIRMIVPLLGKQLIDSGFMAMNFTMIVIYSLAGFLLVIAEQGFNFIAAKFRIHINAKLSFTLARSALKKIFKLKLHFFNNTKIGEIINNINNDVQYTSSIADERIFTLVTSLFSIAGGLAGLAIINWKLTVLAICLVPLQFLVVKYISKKKRKYFELNMEKFKSFWGWYSDVIGGVKEIKLWSIRTIIMGHFVKKQRELINSNIKIAYLDAANQTFDNILSSAIITIIYLVGATMIFRSGLTFGGLIAFISYINFITYPFYSIMGMGGYLFSIIIPSAERLFSFFDMEEESSITGQKRIRLEAGSVNGNISFENVSFSYENDKILDNISLEIKKGEKIALTGANGSGKTTIINLILRFINPDSGRILLDGTDIADISLKDYRGCISVICQSIYLFDASIKDNIALFRKLDENSVFNAARQSAADEFINRMPGKYDSMIGSNGSQISGGEKQKIGVARAFVKKSPILIMDEATSNFDAESDMLVNRILESEFIDVTAVIITHRPEILKRVDRVFALGNGSLVEVEQI